MKIVMIGLILLIPGCTTNEVPDRIANTYEVTGKVYCGTPIFHNVETIVVRWIQATISPTWKPVCGN